MRTEVYHCKKKEDSPSLEEAQKLVGGYVEKINLSIGVFNGQMLVNEDGIHNELPVNDVASLIAGLKIFGNAIILTEKAKWE